MRTEINLEAVCRALLVNCGDFHGACRSAELSPMFVRKWMDDDDKVAERIKNATEVGALGLESAAINRAVNGVEKGIYYQGEVVGYERQYSDGLLTQLLKARVSGYKEESTQNLNVNLAAQIKIMPRANTYAEWLNFASAKPVTVDAEATPVPVLPAPQYDPAMADIL